MFCLLALCRVPVLTTAMPVTVFLCPAGLSDEGKIACAMRQQTPSGTCSQVGTIALCGWERNAQGRGQRTPWCL